MNTIRSLQDALESGSTSSVKLVEESLANIEKNKHQNAYISVLSESALAQAEQADKERAEGQNPSPLAGIPVAIKDNMSMKGTKTTCASKILENFEAIYDGTAVKKLKDSGAIIIGKTNLDEFAMGSTSESSFFGKTLNPQNENLVPGGSSGGSAAAVANGSVAMSLGSDTGGSIRQPAACCGIVGLKPSYGRVSRYGLVAYASSLDQIGPMANNVEDIAITMNAIAGGDENDCTSAARPSEDFTALLDQDIKGKTIGIPAEYFNAGLEDDQKEVIVKSLDKLKAEGAELKEIHLPNVQYCIPSYYILATAEASSNLSRFDGVRYTHRSQEIKTLEDLYSNSRSEAFGEEVKRRIVLGTFVLSSGYYDAYYMQAQKVRRLIKDDFEKAFTSCDIIASPTMPSAPMTLGEAEADLMKMYLSDIYTVSLNLAGLPGISLPCGEANGTKVGIQLMGKAFGETELLGAASALERLG